MHGHGRMRNARKRLVPKGFQYYYTPSSTHSESQSETAKASVTISVSSTTPSTSSTSSASPTTTAKADVSSTSSAAAEKSATSSTPTFANVPPVGSDTSTSSKVAVTAPYVPPQASTATSSTPEETTTSKKIVTVTASASNVRALSSSKVSSSAPSASAALANSNGSESSGMSGGSIAGIIAALVIFAGCILGLMVWRRKARQSRRERAETAIGHMGPSAGGPGGYGSRDSAYELGDADVMGGVGMVERSRSFVTRAEGGPRPPTMIESGRAGIGRGGGAASPVPPMPTIYSSGEPDSSAYSTGAGGPTATHFDDQINGYPDINSHSSTVAPPSAEVYAVGSVLPSPGGTTLSSPAVPGSAQHLISPYDNPGFQQQQQFSPHPYNNQQAYYPQPQGPHGSAYLSGPPPPQPFDQMQPQQPQGHEYPMMFPNGHYAPQQPMPFAAPLPQLPMGDAPPAVAPQQAYPVQQQPHQPMQSQQQMAGQPPRTQQRDDLDDAYGGLGY